jgi:hypothetical protein
MFILRSTIFGKCYDVMSYKITQDVEHKTYRIYDFLWTFWYLISVTNVSSPPKAQNSKQYRLYRLSYMFLYDSIEHSA